MGVLRSASAGAIAGVVATAAMDAVWYRRYRAGGGDRDPMSWEFSTTATSYDDAPAPARVGQRIAGTFGLDLAPSSIATVNNLVHWTTGIGWGKVAGLAASGVGLPALAVGVATGVVAWAASYAALGALGVYEPITAYDAATLWQDLSAHMVFGAALGAVLTIDRALRR